MVPVIGLEVHLQVKTKSKMFCRCSADYFGKSPNINVCPVCMGMPGALPIPNELAFNKTIALALALNCEVTNIAQFDRKNYFYPDLPKGYQITQFDNPIGQNGYVEIEINDDSRRIRIKKVLLEEDTAKSIHSQDGETLIDFNKSGVPLIEIVTEPDFESIEELVIFGKRLRQIVRYVDVSDAEMQKGQMRFELNISVKQDPSSTKLPDYRVEVKNIGSINVLENVARLEIERQKKLLNKGEKIPQQTRGLKNMSGETVLQRIKETSDDYRYFPEPDIPPIRITRDHVENIAKTLPELPTKRKQRYVNLGISNERAEVLVENQNLGELFDKFGENIKWNPALVQEGVNWITSELVGLAESKGKSITEIQVSVSDISYIVELVLNNKITRTVAKQVFEEIIEKGGDAKQIIESRSLIQINSEEEIEKWVDQVIKENPKVVADVAKNPNAIKFLVGQVMKISRGKANPGITEKLLKSKLS
ncbi:MAG: aspartyl/glutamyl-tRNA(Asn/Gln) amidotransferase subunit B [Candidatus Dojkabacteria bacterium]|nr:MAG: aspartyl/glutamyl-tRNA(Asn/Gln) amidotransferase subunit B [Candidatus Dojkabacteria bacterium]